MCILILINMCIYIYIHIYTYSFSPPRCLSMCERPAKGSEQDPTGVAPKLMKPAEETSRTSGADPCPISLLRLSLLRLLDSNFPRNSQWT